MNSKKPKPPSDELPEETFTGNLNDSDKQYLSWHPAIQHQLKKVVDDASKQDAAIVHILLDIFGNDQVKIWDALWFLVPRDKLKREDYIKRTITACLCVHEFDKEKESDYRIDYLSKSPDLVTEQVSAFDTTDPEQQQKTYKRPLLTISQMRMLPPKKWLVKNHLKEKSFVCTYGAEGSGKSFLTLDLALSFASGKSWQGIYEIPKIPVLYIYSEGFEDMQLRVEAWLKHHGINEDDIGSSFLASGSTYNFCEKSESFEILSQFHDITGKAPQFVVIDTLSRNFDGEENDGSRMKQYVENLDWIKKMTNATVNSIHHQGKDRGKGLRGSSTLAGACDTIIHCGSNMEGSVTTVSCEKQKDGKRFESFKITREIVQLGDETTSCVWNIQNAILTRWQFQKAEVKEFASWLICQFANREFARTDVEDYGQKSPPTLHRYLNDLVKAGLIIQTKRGCYKVLQELINQLSCSY